ncbi:MAG: hypothetical protein KDA37_08225 [Planctomycetales bacterium]|nr:hypothetical protein [Planctomycetales bacterium]
MAARQDQTLQIIAIILTGLVVVFFALTIWFYTQNDNYRQEAEAANQKASEKENAARQFQGEAEAYLSYMGFKPFEDKAAVDSQFKADMENFAGTFGEEERKYRLVLETFSKEIENSAEQESDAKRRLQELEEQRDSQLAEKDKEIAEFKKQVDATKADNARLRQEFQSARDAFEKKREELEQVIAKSRVNYRKQLEAEKAKLDATEETLAKTKVALEEQLEIRQQEDPSFEVADGRVTWVNQRNRTVWINLGEADSLRPQITFSVYEQDLDDAGRAEKKASIEVVRLLDEHLAEARITDDSNRNPIMPGDHIYSQVWHRGKQLHFALAGVIDLDGDGRNDVQAAKDLIRLNGGAIDAVQEADGSVDGEVTVKTRYLVLGGFPKAGAYRAAEISKGYKDMSDEAEAYGVEQITLQEFLDQMGYRTLDRTTGLGDNLRGSDFESKDGARFRPRSAYAPIGR